MEATIKTLPQKKLVGKHLKMSLAQNKTAELWKNFMQSRKEITNNLTNELFSMQVYEPSFNFKDFGYDTVFEKWAAAEVADFNSVPAGMEPFTLPGGLYAVFIYKGDATNAEKTFRYIFDTWLPASDYLLDNRPHFEILGEKYKNNHPDSEEEIWIPVTLKS